MFCLIKDIVLHVLELAFYRHGAHVYALLVSAFPISVLLSRLPVANLFSCKSITEIPIVSSKHKKEIS